MKNKYRQGELLIVPVDNVSGDKQANLLIASWEGQNSKHEFKSGDVELYFVDEVTLNALIKSEVGVITHPEHGDLEIPKGAYKIIIQREYLPDISEYEKCRKNASDAINRLVEAVFNTDPDKINPKALYANSDPYFRIKVINRIGYYRVLRGLPNSLMDKWREYKLYHIENVDIETLAVLEMECPKTKKLFHMRVPPDIKTAYEAITWINWGIKPEEFVKEI